MQARRRFGQNFLHDKNIRQKIIKAINPQPEDHILEIGPGHGALTELILASGCQLDVIEVDRDLASELRLKYPDLNVIAEDVLKFDIASLHKKRPLRVVGNLPYNISTPLLFRLFSNLDVIDDMFFMLQLEVVNRITASHSTKDYGRLSLMSQFYCDSTKLFNVSPEAFVPRPKVTSAVIHLTPKIQNHSVDVVMLQKILTQAFSMRRKTIRNALKGYVNETQIKMLGLNPQSRPENLDLANFISITEISQAEFPGENGLD